MPYPFFRPDSSVQSDFDFADTSIPNDPSFALINQSDFLVFDRERGLELLGPNPKFEVMFNVTPSLHEAPVYITSQNKLYLSQLPPPYGYLPQLVIDLNREPPTISEFLPDPPIYAVNGGTSHNGLIYWGAAGSVDNVGGIQQRPSIHTVDPATNKSTTILNNYFGSYFNTIDDLFVHPNGDVWFTDPEYGYFGNLTSTPPKLPPATYRFRPSTGAVTVVEDTLTQPNGIAFDPSSNIVYISDSGALTSTNGGPGISFSPSDHRTIYAYDLSPDATFLTNKRAFYLSQDYVPDGIKVARNGYVVIAAGKGVDVLDRGGRLLVRVRAGFGVQNCAWGGTGGRTLWLVGTGKVARVVWGLEGGGF
ncbi:MAG: hypothetical protein Q9220_006220 [cf. Caloplaca sp. 1 TL-2023]